MGTPFNSSSSTSLTEIHDFDFLRKLLAQKRDI